MAEGMKRSLVGDPEYEALRHLGGDAFAASTKDCMANLGKRVMITTMLRRDQIQFLESRAAALAEYARQVYGKTVTSLTLQEMLSFLVDKYQEETRS